MPIEDSPFLMMAASVSTDRGLHQYIHHQGTKRMSDFVILTQLFCQKN